MRLKNKVLFHSCSFIRGEIMDRIASIVVIAGFLLAACGQAPQVPPARPSTPGQLSPTPTLAATSTRIPTRTALPSPTQTFEPTAADFPTSTPEPATLTPEHDATGYRLAPLDVDSGWKIFEKILPTGSQDDTRPGYSEYDRRDTAFLFDRELLRRFPLSEKRNQIIAYLDAPTQQMDFGMSALRHGSFLDLLSTTFEDAMNKTGGSIDPDTEQGFWDIDSLLRGELSLKDTGLLGKANAKNLFGDNNDAWLLELQGSGSYYLLMALEKTASGEYRAGVIEDDWQDVFHRNRNWTLRDLNGNGKPEVAVDFTGYGMGLTRICSKDLNLYEWDGLQFRNLTPDIHFSTNANGGDCMEFSFGPDSQGVPVIRTGVVFGNGCSGGDTGEDRLLRGTVGIQDTYQWNGSQFAFLKKEILSLDELVADGQFKPSLSLECQLAWANEIGPVEPSAVQTLQTILSQPVDATLQDEWGDAYQDFFKFKLGTWLAMLGERSQATSILQQVQKNPSVARYPTTSQLATAFMQPYLTSNAYQGCVAVNQVLDFKPFSTDGLYLDTKKMRVTWGFADPFWVNGSCNTLFSGPFLRDDLANVCNLSTAFYLSVKDKSFASAAEFVQWLNGQGIPYWGMQKGDADGDGDEDWMIILATGSDQGLQLWTLLRNGNSVQPIRVKDGLAVEGKEIPTAWSAFRPTPGARVVNAYRYQGQMIQFELITDQTPVYAEVIFDSYYDKSYDEHLMSFSVREVHGGKGQELVAQYEKLEAVYGLDPQTGKVGRISSPEIEQEKAIQKIETLILETQDAAAAARAIEALLAPGYPLIEHLDNNQPARVRPYLEYLLGVAYELSGDPDQALQAFYQLWKEFPNSPYSEIVRQRLVQQ
jgi:hypothetical protein